MRHKTRARARLCAHPRKHTDIDVHALADRPASQPNSVLDNMNGGKKEREKNMWNIRIEKRARNGFDEWTKGIYENVKMTLNDENAHWATRNLRPQHSSFEMLSRKFLFISLFLLLLSVKLWIIYPYFVYLSMSWRFFRKTIVVKWRSIYLRGQNMIKWTSMLLIQTKRKQKQSSQTKTKRQPTNNIVNK